MANAKRVILRSVAASSDEVRSPARRSDQALITLSICGETRTSSSEPSIASPGSGRPMVAAT